MGSEDQQTVLEESTFENLFKQNRLPSGHSFELMPDTVETALRVAEVNDSKSWKEKALQAYVVCKKIGHFDVQEQGPGFIHNLLDTDVTFLSLAWAAQMNGTTIGLEEGGVPCPTCSVAFKEVNFGDLKIHCRPTPIGGPDGMFKVDAVSDAELPNSLQGCTLFVTDPTWQLAKSKLTDSSWGVPQAVILHRMMCTLRASSQGGTAPRALSLKGEVNKLKSSVIPKVVQVMNDNIPHFVMQLDLKCQHCGEVAVVPFEQAL